MHMLQTLLQAPTAAIHQLHLAYQMQSSYIHVLILLTIVAVQGLQPRINTGEHTDFKQLN